MAAALLLTAATTIHTLAQPGWVLSHQKISDTAGGFGGSLNNGDRFGFSVASLGDLDGDGVGDLAVGASLDDNGGTDRGAVWILFLNAEGKVKSHQKISDTAGDFTGTLDNIDRFGYAVAALGDLDGDGVGDVAVGAPRDDDGGRDHGAVWVLFLNPEGTVKSHQKISDTAGGFTGILDNLDFFGNSLASLGDLDGDGVGDLAVGALLDDDGGSDRGAVWVLFLNPDGTVKSHQKISDTAGGFTGSLATRDWFGFSVASLGDLDGDGVGDLAVGAVQDDDGGTDRGALWILFLNADATVKSHQKISDTQGGFTGTLDDGDRFGDSLAPLGDLDGDGVRDLAVGASADDDGGDRLGAVWLLFLNAAGTVKSHQKISSTAGGFTGTLDTEDWFGNSAAALGDLDGDGVGDLAVGALGDDDGGDDRGAVWVLFLDGVAAPRPGDLNCDGRLDGADIDPFFLALGAPSLYLARFPYCNRLNGDLNCDGLLNGADIDAFFNCLGGNCADCNANGIPDYCETLDPLTIITQPQDTSPCVGDRGTLTVETNRALSHQWRKNGVEIPGATSNPLVFGSVQLSDAGDYDVIVADACVSLLSDVARMTVLVTPVIDQQPQSQTVCLGERLVLRVGATGGDLSYQWRRNGQNIAGATQATFVVSSATRADAGDYDVEIRNPCGRVVSDTAMITVAEFIFTHPVSQTVCENDPVVFSVGAFGKSLTYQWRKDGFAIGGATANFFVIPAAQLNDAGVYDVAVTSPECTQISETATLTVRQCP